MFRTESAYLEWLQSVEGLGVFVYPSYWQAVIGINAADGGLIYDYDRMVDVLVMDNEMSVEDAIGWIDYNVLRTIPYIEGIKPVVIKQEEN